jgi:hypothetical protein
MKAGRAKFAVGVGILAVAGGGATLWYTQFSGHATYLAKCVGDLAGETPNSEAFCDKLYRDTSGEYSTREAFIYRCNELGEGGTFTSFEYCEERYAQSAKRRSSVSVGK